MAESGNRIENKGESSLTITEIRVSINLSFSGIAVPSIRHDFVLENAFGISP